MSKREELFSKISVVVREIYSFDSLYIKTSSFTSPQSISSNIRKAKEIMWKKATKNGASTAAFRMKNIISQLKYLKKTGDMKKYNLYKGRFIPVYEGCIKLIINYNVNQCLKNPMSIDDILSLNADNGYISFFSSGDITDVINEVVVPKKIQKKILDILPSNPWDYYDKARKISRHFFIHVGGTNTGKTYQSIERLKEVQRGAYLSPLRLLAMEVQEKLNESGVPCSLLTGEEEETIPGAGHISSTVELADMNKVYDVVVIDECQMIEDFNRGGFWTSAILGMQSPEIHLCMAPSALEICKKLIDDCGDTYEIINHERFVPLIFSPLQKGFKIERDLRDGDALVVFSRKDVLKLAALLEDKGIKSSVVYGALPYSSRKEQVRQFSNNETRIVVATDAIGMGLNLPIHRIIFMDTSKYDGEIVRPLKTEEIKQIAGRAGRRGMYEEGYVSTLKTETLISESISAKSDDIDFVYENFPETLLDIVAAAPS